MIGSTYKPHGRRFGTQAGEPGPVAAPSLAVSGGAEGPASSSLEECTLNENNVYRCTLKEFGDGVVSLIGVYQERAWRGGKRKARDVEEAKGLHPHTQRERSEFSRRRARRSLRERCLMLRADRMLTLTKRGKFEDREAAWRAWDGFRRRAIALWSSKFQFVVVIEPHRVGGYHLHVALSGYFDVGMLRRLWMKALGGKGNESGTNTPGNVDISGAVSSPRSRERIASYIAKYLGKDVDAIFRSRRSFASSRGIPAPRIVRWTQAVYSATCPIAVAMRRLRDAVSPDARGRGGRLVGLQWWRFQFGGCHGFTVTPI